MQSNHINLLTQLNKPKTQHGHTHNTHTCKYSVHRQKNMSDTQTPTENTKIKHTLRTYKANTYKRETLINDTPTTCTQHNTTNTHMGTHTGMQHNIRKQINTHTNTHAYVNLQNKHNKHSKTKYTKKQHTNI